MSKLAAQTASLDLSDYGRPFENARESIKNTRFTPYPCHASFGISGLIAIYCILETILPSWFSLFYQGSMPNADTLKNTLLTGKIHLDIFTSS
jgi:hypothetical protein